VGTLRWKTFTRMYGWLWVRDSEQGVPCEQRTGQANDAAGKSDPAHSGANRLPSEHTEDSLRQRTAVRSHHQDGRVPPLFHEREGAGILDGIATKGNGCIVTAALTFGTNAFIQPPDGGVIEQQSLSRNLEKIHEWIKPLDVRQFVRDNRLQLLLGKARESSHRQQDDRTKPANDRWRCTVWHIASTRALGAVECLLRSRSRSRNPPAERRLKKTTPNSQASTSQGRTSHDAGVREGADELPTTTSSVSVGCVSATEDDFA
jgi:hypothetical protein